MEREERSHTGEVVEDQNVFLRILNLRSVSGALQSIEQTYIRTKQSHPIISSVCGVYEKGVGKAGSLAVWSVKPAFHALEPQIVAANSMACRGLDHLEQKVPALQYPPAELAATVKELVSSTVGRAKDGITSPIRSTSNTVLSMATSGYQQSKNTVSDNIQYVLNSRPVRLAEQGVERALTLTERLVDFILPVSTMQTEEDAVGEQKPDVGASGPKPSLSRLRALAGTVCRRAFAKTAVQLQRTKTQGQELVTRIPGVTPLVDYTRRSLKAIGGVVLGIPSSVGAFLKHGEQQSPLSETTNKESAITPKKQGNGVQSLVTGLGQTLQEAYVTVVTNVKKAPHSSFTLAKDGVSFALGSFGSAGERALRNLSYYGLLPGRSSKPKRGSQPTGRDEKDGAEKLLPGSPALESNGADHPHSPTDTSDLQSLKSREPKEIPEETRLLKKKVLKQIPVQQKVILEGNNKKVPSHTTSKKSQADHKQTSSSSYNRTVQNRRNSIPTAE